MFPPLWVQISPVAEENPPGLFLCTQPSVTGVYRLRADIESTFAVTGAEPAKRTCEPEHREGVLKDGIVRRH